MTVSTILKASKGKSRRKQDIPGITRPMTYEEYISGPEEMARYDILDGWKVYRLYGDNLLPSPTRRHQRILGKLFRCLQDYEEQSAQGETIQAPCDVQITYQPLRSRQPDLLFISHRRLEENAPEDEYSPLAPAPELVVEIVSPSDTPSVLAAKIDDYRRVDVREVWVVRSGPQTVEVLPLSFDGTTSTTYTRDEMAVSRAFAGLTVPVDEIFQE